MKKIFSFIKRNKEYLSPLDKAYIDALQDKNKQATFYNFLLSTELFIPTVDIPAENKIKRAEENESISPVILEVEGVKYLPLFDSEARLASWAKQKIGYIGLVGVTLIEIIDPDLHWILNIGTEYVKTFTPDEIQWLKQNILNAKPQTKIIPSGVEVLIGTPANVPNGLLDMLVRILKLNMEVNAAYLSQIHFSNENKPHLVLMLDISAAQDSVIKSIVDMLSVAVLDFCNKEPIDLMIKENSDPLAAEIAKTVEPFYLINNQL